jgi:RNA polymerase sigma factor (sigma-70 family)
MKGEQEHNISDLLHRLNSADAGSAWAEFIDRYAQLIMNTATQIEFEQDRVNDCFLYVCEKLNDEGFRRLLKFNTRGAAKFSTWLGSVVFNLCVDWHRREYGRVRLLPAIAALPAFDQCVYHHVIGQGMNKEGCFQKLRLDYPDLERESIANALNRIYMLLTPRQCWQIGVRNRGRKPVGENWAKDQVERLPDPGAGPEIQVQRQQELELLQNALSHLPASQRLLLQLRFQEGLSLKKIAKLQQLGDTNHAWQCIQRATEALFDYIHKNNPAKNQKN